MEDYILSYEFLLGFIEIFTSMLFKSNTIYSHDMYYEKVSYQTSWTNLILYKLLYNI